MAQQWAFSIDITNTIVLVYTIVGLMPKMVDMGFEPTFLVDSSREVNLPGVCVLPSCWRRYLVFGQSILTQQISPVQNYGVNLFVEEEIVDTINIPLLICFGRLSGRVASFPRGDFQ